MYSLDINFLSDSNRYSVSERASERELLIQLLFDKCNNEIPLYREKWRGIALQTGPIDRHKAKEAVKSAYAVLGKQEPEIVFFDSPYAALSTDNLSLFGDDSWSQLENLLDRQQWSQRVSQPWQELAEQLEKQLAEELPAQLTKLLMGELKEELNNRLKKSLKINFKSNWRASRAN